MISKTIGPYSIATRPRVELSCKPLPRSPFSFFVERVVDPPADQFLSAKSVYGSCLG